MYLSLYYFGFLFLYTFFCLLEILREYIILKTKLFLQKNILENTKQPKNNIHSIILLSLSSNLFK